MSDAPTMATVTTDDVEVSVFQGTLATRAAEQIGTRIPCFCDHPLSKSVAACCQCLVKVRMPDRNTGELCFMPKSQPSYAQAVTPRVAVKIQFISEVAKKAQHGVMGFLLINHPLDCPIRNKGEECPLQDQAAMDGHAASRFINVKYSYRKPLRLASQILLDRERYVLCQHCVRLGKEISGDVFLDLQDRGGSSVPTDEHYFVAEQIGGFDTTTLDFHDPEGKEHSVPEFSDLYGEAGLLGALNCGELTETDRNQPGRTFTPYSSDNIMQICPVGALTVASYRSRAHLFGLVPTVSVAEHDASSSAIHVDIRRGKVVRRMARNEPEANEEWITGKDRFTPEWEEGSRLRTSLARVDGALVPTPWSDALDMVRKNFEAVKGRVGFLPGGHLTFGGVWAWPKFMRAIAGSGSIDFHSRALSEEERFLLASEVAGSGLGVSHADLEKVRQVLLAAFEPEDECSVIFLRLRKAVLKGGLKVTSVAPFTSKGSAKLSVRLLRVAPGTEVEVLISIAEGEQNANLVGALKGGVALADRRTACAPNLFSAALELAECTGARLQQVPRRAGSRGAIKAGLPPGLLPLERPLDDATPREQVGWALPQARGLDASAQLEGTINSSVSALMVGDINVQDFEDSASALHALEAVLFLVSLEVRTSDATELADVVLPVATLTERNRTFINWEGRLHPFGQAIPARSLTDHEVSTRLAEKFGVDLGVMALTDLYREANTLMGSSRAREELAPLNAPAPTPADVGQAILATHKPMSDAGRFQDGASWLAGSARRPIVLASENTFAAAGAAPDCALTLTNEHDSTELPAFATDSPDSIMRVSECSQGSPTHQSLGTADALVTLGATGEMARWVFRSTRFLTTPYPTSLGRLGG